MKKILCKSKFFFVEIHADKTHIYNDIRTFRSNITGMDLRQVWVELQAV